MNVADTVDALSLALSHDQHPPRVYAICPHDTFIDTKVYQVRDLRDIRSVLARPVGLHWTPFDPAYTKGRCAGNLTISASLDVVTLVVKFRPSS